MSSRPRRRWRSSRPRARTSSRPCCGLRRRSGPTRRRSHQVLLRLPRRPGDPRLRSPLPVHPRGRLVGVLRARRASTSCPGLQRGGRRRARALRGRFAARQAAAAGPAAVGHARSRPSSCAGSGFRFRVELLRELRFGRGLDNRRLKASGFALPIHDPRGRPEAPGPAAAAARCCGSGAAPVPLRARGRGVPAPQPERPALPGGPRSPTYDELCRGADRDHLLARPSRPRRAAALRGRARRRRAVLPALDRSLAATKSGALKDALQRARRAVSGFPAHVQSLRHR